MMPSQYTADMSQQDARAEAEALKVRYSEIAIKPIFDTFLKALAGEFKGLAADTTEDSAFLSDLLIHVLEKGCSDLHLTVGAHPTVRLSGRRSRG